MIKISPDIKDNEISKIVELVSSHKIKGIIVSNTTDSNRDNLSDIKKHEVGGLSGQPLKDISTNLIKKNKIKRVLIVCPSSLMQNWADELNIWAQSFKGYQVSASSNTDSLWKGIIKHGHFFIVNYDQLRSVSDVFIKNPFDLIICDEAHKLRKKTSLIHNGLKKL